MRKNTKLLLPKYTVLRDTKEKVDYWDFPKTSCCNGTIWHKLATGDYSLADMMDFFTIERKANTGEFAGNISTERFERELARMDKMDQAYLILEFSWKDIDSFPFNSGIPAKYWPDLRTNSGYIRKRLIEIMSDYNIQVILADGDGQYIAESIFKRMHQLYAK